MYVYVYIMAHMMHVYVHEHILMYNFTHIHGDGCLCPLIICTVITGINDETTLPEKQVIAINYISCYNIILSVFLACIFKESNVDS